MMPHYYNYILGELVNRLYPLRLTLGLLSNSESVTVKLECKYHHGQLRHLPNLVRPSR